MHVGMKYEASSCVILTTTLQTPNAFSKAPFEHWVHPRLWPVAGTRIRLSVNVFHHRPMSEYLFTWTGNTIPEYFWNYTPDNKFFFNFLLRIRQMTCWSENDRLIIREITRKQEWLCCITFSPCLGFFSTQTICFYCKINMLHKLHTKQKTQVIHQWEMFQTTLIHHGQIFDFIRTLNQTD